MTWFNRFKKRYRESRMSSEKGAFQLLSGVQIPDDWARYSTQVATDFEIVHRPLWDTNTFVSASTLSLNFFNTARATPDLGNEVFPLKNSYLACALGVFFKDGAQNDVAVGALGGGVFASRFNDHVLITNTGVLNITIGQKLYGPFPLWKLNPGAGIWGIIAAGGTPQMADYSQLGWPSPEAMYTLAIPLVIPMNTSCLMQMVWPATITLTGNSTVCLLVDGKEARPLQ